LTPFTLVYVCTANRGRSPVAEALTRSAAPAHVAVRSRGVHAEPGLPPLREVVAAAAARGIDIAAHRSQPLEQASLLEADLVVGFERVHAAAAVVDGAAPRGRVFTLPELVRLLEQLGGSPRNATPAALIAAAAGRRAPAPAGTTAVLDPVGRSQAEVDRIVAEVDAWTKRLIAALFGR